jgi:large subunit ribosomal protein L21
MYAIIENGGKQYKAFEGKYIDIDLLPDEVGKKKSFDKVLLLSTDDKIEVGEPFLKGVSVDGTILSHFKGPKLTIFKYRAKQRFRVKTGHRQKHTRVLIDSIAFPGKAAVVNKVEETPEVEKVSPTKKTTSTAKKSTKKVVKSTSTAAKKPAAKSQTTTKESTSTAAKKPAAKSQTTAKKSITTKKTAESKKPSADKK